MRVCVSEIQIRNVTKRFIISRSRVSILSQYGGTEVDVTECQPPSQPTELRGLSLLDRRKSTFLRPRGLYIFFPPYRARQSNQSADVELTGTHYRRSLIQQHAPSFAQLIVSDFTCTSVLGEDGRGETVVRIVRQVVIVFVSEQRRQRDGEGEKSG